MGARIRDKRNVKIFVLYLMQNINYPLDFVTVNEIVMQTDYVMYLDFAESLLHLKEFLKIRESIPLFAEVKTEGGIGIPCIVKEDGSITLDWTELM